MASMNRVILLGRLVKDPDLRFTPAGQPVADMRMAVNRAFRGKDGALKEDTCFVSVVVWAKQAERCAQFLKKGRLISVEGRLQQDSWTAKTGEKRTRHRVVADRVQFLSFPRNGDHNAGSGSHAEPQESEEAEAPLPAEDVL